MKGFTIRFTLPVCLISILTLLAASSYSQTGSDVSSNEVNTEATDSLSSGDKDSTSVDEKQISIIVIKDYLWSGLKYSWQLGLTLYLEPGHIEKSVRDVKHEVEKIFRPHGERIGWMPMLGFTSGPRPKLGLTLYYRRDSFLGALTGDFAGALKYNSELRLNWDGTIVQMYDWRLHVNFMQRFDDDLRFYGIGNDPANDPRSHFRMNSPEDVAKFTQKKRRIMLLAGTRTSEDIELFVLSRYTERKFFDAGFGSSDIEKLGQVFNLDEMTEMEQSHGSIYNEILFRYDDRDAFWSNNAGFSFDLYMGHQFGIQNDRSRLLRTGGELRCFTPTLRKDWLFTPAIVVLSLIHI